MSAKILKIIVVGQPNSGKTRLVNTMTGANLRVGNFAGVTVDVAEISTKHQEHIITFLDLPGLYSMEAFSEEENITCQLIEKIDSYDVILNVIESTHLEKGLQLTAELLRLKKPTICAVNMIDEARKLGFDIDCSVLNKTFGLPFIKTSSTEKINIQELKNQILFLAKSQVEVRISLDDITRSQLIHEGATKAIIQCINQTQKRSVSEKIDNFLMHKIFGLPIFLATMFGIFSITFFGGEGPSGMIESAGEILGNLAIEKIGSSLLSLLLVGGILPGIFTVLAFLPKIMILFACISILEKSGYMARISFLMDGFLSACGLHGKAIVPLMSGFSCSIPAYMSTRILCNKTDKLATMFAIGFIPCSAKMTLFAMLCDAFFKSKASYAMMSIYCGSIVVALLIAKATSIIATSKTNKEQTEPFLMELPSYRMPDVNSIIIEMIAKSKSYIKNAGTFIAVMSIGIWTLSHVPLKITDKNYWQTLTNSTLAAEQKEDYILSESILGNVSKGASFLFAPMNLDWKMTTSLFAAVAAKEVAISTLGILYNSDNEVGLKENLRQKVTTPSMIAYITFAAMYVPCLSAVAMFSREIRSRKITIILVVGTVILAWISSWMAYVVAAIFV